MATNANEDKLIEKLATDMETARMAYETLTNAPQPEGLQERIAQRTALAKAQVAMIRADREFHIQLSNLTSA